MNNSEIADTLTEIAELLELKGESSFRIRAYETGSQTIGALTESVETLCASGDLKKVKGIGTGLAQKVDELVKTGHIQYLTDLRAQFPTGVRSFLRIPGVGPVLARRVFRELDVTTVEDLRAAAEDGRLASLTGLGEKSAQNVLRGLSRVSKRDARISLGKALPVVDELIASLQNMPGVRNVTAAGSLRRWCPTIGDIDLIATSPDPAPVMEAFVTLPRAVHVLGQGPTKSSIVTESGLQIDLRILEQEHFGSLLQHFTGSKAHNVELREYSLKLGYSLSEHGITATKSGDLAEFQDEPSFYAALGMDYIPPELREGHGEIAAARNHSLPSLVEVDDIRGDLHSHSDWSDGGFSMEDMVRAAKERGYEYVAVTDHSSGAGMAGGASTDRLIEQLQAIQGLQKKIGGIHILSGSEVEIKPDGRLDFPDDILAKLDFVVASVHSAFNQTEHEMTSRVIQAMENPHVDMIGHPTGRLIGKREPYALDLEAIFSAAARTHTALEINSHPDRLDLVDTHARRAVEMGAMLAVNTDAHAPVHLGYLRYGIAMARRGWAEPKNVLNTWSLGDLRSWLTSGER